MFLIHIYIGYLENNDKSFTEWIKLKRKIFYYFAIFVIINKILIAKNCRKLVFNNFLLKYYQLCRKTARDENYLFFSHRTLWIFSEFFINFLILHFLIFINMRKYSIKKFWKSSKKLLELLPLWKIYHYFPNII